MNSIKPAIFSGKAKSGIKIFHIFRKPDKKLPVNSVDAKGKKGRGKQWD
jgi:hypothetical protein